MNSGKAYSRRHILAATGKTATAAMLLRPSLGWAVEATDSTAAKIVDSTLGIDAHNHIDVPLTTSELPGPDIDLGGELKRSGLPPSA